jgi:hypothetical protein
MFSGVAKCYRGEDQALEMDLKVWEGKAFEVDIKGEILQN